jgi:hypothetical protein
MVTTYSKDLAVRLTTCRAIAKLLVREHCAYHRKFINAALTLGFMPLAILCLHVKLFGQMRGGNVSTSCNTPSPDLGKSSLSYLAGLTS